MINDLFVFVVALLMVTRGATLATTYAARLAESYRLSKYTVGFIIIAVISILPETFIAVNAAFEGMSAFGLGVLFGSNIADLTLLFALLVFIARRGLKVESKILANHVVYPFILLLPILLGLDGHFSRWEGVALIGVGGLFYYFALKKGVDGSIPVVHTGHKIKNSLLLLCSMALMLVGGHFTVTAATAFAGYMGISPILIGMLVVGLGTTMPEFFFSLKSVKKKDDSLAIGDILGTVLADATIVVGILALVNPFSFPTKSIYLTGMFMVSAAFVLFSFMKSEKVITKREAVLLFLFWLLFVVVEFFITTL